MVCWVVSGRESAVKMIEGDTGEKRELGAEELGLRVFSVGESDC
jgi:hypothetical protein